MGETTGIGWCHHTYNHWTGCTKVSPACDECYAEKRSLRFGHGAYEAGVPRRRTKTFREPYRWDRLAAEAGERRRCFAHSLSDVFDAEVSDEWREGLFKIIRETPHLDWLVLTKRHSVAAAYYEKHGTPVNVWAGVSVENQKMARARIPHLLRIEAKVRFLSVEPMLEPIDLSPWLSSDVRRSTGGIDWVIIGGESHRDWRKARPFDVKAARRLLEQCTAAGVPVFMKQFGSRPVLFADDQTTLDTHMALTHPKGEDPLDWPVWAQRQEFPETRLAA